MFRRRYVNVVKLDNVKDATLAAGLVGAEKINCRSTDRYPVIVALPEHRPYLLAVWRSVQLSDSGLFNIILRVS